jgi:hypothetical protein
MKVDKKTLDMLSRMPDERLWHTLCLLASGMGAELSERKRNRIDYDALRYTLAQITEKDIERMNEAAEMYRTYRRSGGRR